MPFPERGSPMMPTQGGIDRRRQLAEALMRAGQQGNGLAGPWGAIASALTGGIAGWQQKKAGQEQTTLDDERKRKMAEALAGFGGDPATLGAVSQLPLEQQQAMLGNITAARLAPKPRQLTKVGAGETIIDETGKTVFGAPAAPTKLGSNERLIGPDGKPIVDAVQQFERFDGGDSWIFTDQQGREVNRISKSASPDAILQASTQRRGQDITASTATRGQDIGAETAKATAAAAAARAGRRDAASLRKEFRGLPTVKDYENVLPILNSVRSSPDTLAGDLDVVYAVGKILDPGSVVREGELKLTQNAAPFLEQLVGKVRAEVSGKGRITPDTRKAFVDMLEQRVKGYEQAYGRDYDTYGQYATDIGAEADQIVGTRPETAFKRTPPLAPTGAQPPAQLASAEGSPSLPQQREAPPAALEFLGANPTPENKAQFRAKFGYLPPGM